MRTIQVTEFNDIVDLDDGKISLQEAIELASTKAFPGPNFIELD